MPSGALTGERNDVALAGLNHKLGYRGIPNTLLNFGEGKYPARGGAAPARSATSSASRGEGLRCMFHMMNEARIAVGLGAAMLGYAGYEARSTMRRAGRRAGRSASAARTRRSRRCRSSSTPTSSACCSRRRATAKARSRSSCTARAWSTSSTPATPQRRREAALLLEVLTPIAKSWPSEWCLEANSLAIQVHGGYGYTRDFPVEQYWRDNRLNMIHEGTHGIQALDLLGRKVVMDGGAGLEAAGARASSATIDARARRRRRWPSMPTRWPPRCDTLGARDAGRLGDRRARGGARQRDAVPAGVRPHRARVDLARRRAVRAERDAHGDRRCRSRAASSPRRATSSATSCRGSAPGWRSSRRATPPAGRWPRSGSEAARPRGSRS